MGKKGVFFILTIVLVLVSNGFARDNAAIDTVSHNDLIAGSGNFLHQTGGVMIAENTVSATEEDDLDKALLEDFGDPLEPVSVSDPLYYFNRLMYSVNDFLYFNALKPIAKGYKAIMPTPARKGVKNFFHNLVFPVRFVNNILQGEIRDAGTEIQIFLINSTLGAMGFAQVAQDRYDLHTANEDLGQTLGSYQIGNGFYIVLPILGSSTLRDLIGSIGDSFLTPINYVEPWEVSTGIKAFDTINTISFHLGDYEAIKDAALDPYVAIRNAYIQNRKERIKE